jgi:hypothetical protein
MSPPCPRLLASIGAATVGEGDKTSLFEAPVSSGEPPIFPLN